MKAFETVRGMRDFLPEDLAKRRLVEDQVRECFRLYGYEEIETPVIESFELIAAKVGDDIRHRLYTLKDLSGRKLAMRPEMTASVARLLTKKLRSEAKPLRLGYIANCFRYDNPQMGRYREFWQAGFELFGSDRAEADAEIIILFHFLMRKLGFRNFTIKLGNVGVLKGLLDVEAVEEKDQNIIMGLLDKRNIKKALVFLDELKVSYECKTVVKKLVALRGNDWTRVISKGREAFLNSGALGRKLKDRQILSRKTNKGDDPLSALDKLELVMQLSQAGGVTSTMSVDLGFTRGLEYYTGMIFEVFVPNLGIALGGGGRYDKLVELFGGEPTPAVGSSPGIDRIVLAMEKEGLFSERTTHSNKVLVIPVGESLVNNALTVAGDLRGRGISTEVEFSGKGVSQALSYAGKKCFAFAVIIGPREREKNSAVIRDLRLKTQWEVPIIRVAEEIKTKQ